MLILVIEDEAEIAEGICTVLEHEGYQVDIAYDGQSGLAKIMEGKPDLVLLDIMLPEINGTEIIKTVRENGISVPVIMLTALSQSSDIINGLDSGADDYLTKPFRAGELLARIRARLRRHDEFSVSSLEYEDICLDRAAMKLVCGEKSVKLARKEFILLETLVINQGIIIPRETLITKIWGYNDNTEYNQLDVYISFVRKKLRFVNSETVITTAKGIGYSLEKGD